MFRSIFGLRNLGLENQFYCYYHLLPINCLLSRRMSIYSPLNTGFRFSLNALSASIRSELLSRGSYAARSKSRPEEGLSTYRHMLDSH